MDQVRRAGGYPKIHSHDSRCRSGRRNIVRRAASIQVFEDDGVEASGRVLDKRH